MNNFIENLKRQHELGKSEPYDFRGTVDFSKSILEAEDATSIIVKNIPVQERLRITYMGIIMKHIAVFLAAAIADNMRNGKIRSTKHTLPQVVSIINKWDENLSEEGLPAGTRDIISTLTTWWMDDGGQQIINEIHHAYAAQLRSMGMEDGNGLDMIAYIFTIKYIGEQSDKWENDGAARMNMVLKGSLKNHVRQSNQRIGEKIKVFAKELINDVTNIKEVPDTERILKWKNEFRRYTTSYDAVEMVAQATAQEVRYRNEQECPVDRCSQCEKKCRDLLEAKKEIKRS